MKVAPIIDFSGAEGFLLFEEDLFYLWRYVTIIKNIYDAVIEDDEFIGDMMLDLAAAVEDLESSDLYIEPTPHVAQHHVREGRTPVRVVYSDGEGRDIAVCHIDWAYLAD